MATAIAATTLRTNPLANDDLLLREILHRSANDLQLVIGLLSFEARQAASADTRGALGAVAGRVAALARAREAMQTGRQRNLAGTLRAVCAALQSQAGPRGILVSLDIDAETAGLSTERITCLALAANELATNAIRHGFGSDQAGHVRIAVGCHDDEHISIIVDDDGALAGSELGHSETGIGASSLGPGLARRLVAAADALLIVPGPDSKRFEIRVRTD